MNTNTTTTEWTIFSRWEGAELIAIIAILILLVVVAAGIFYYSHKLEKAGRT